MAYAVLENGKPKVYGALPKAYHSEVANVIGGFDKLPNDELEKHGFYPVEDEEVEDPLFYEKGELYFDEKNSIFKYIIKEIQHRNIVDLKEEKLLTIESQKNSRLGETNDIVLEYLELGLQIPEDIKNKRLEIRETYKREKSRIEKINTLREILTYK